MDAQQAFKAILFVIAIALPYGKILHGQIIVDRHDFDLRVIDFVDSMPISKNIEVSAVTQTKNSAQQTLEFAQIEPTADSIREHFEQCKPTEEKHVQAMTWIKQLGDESFSVRENATTRLMHFSYVPYKPILAASQDDDDLEKSIRAKMILQEKYGPVRKRLDTAIANLIFTRKIKGLSKEVAAKMKSAKTDSRRAIWLRALLATSVESDRELLIQLASDSVPKTKLAAIETLSKIDPAEATKLLHFEIKKSEDDTFKIDAAYIFAKMNRIDSLHVAVELLSSKNKRVQRRAVHLLTRATRAKFGFPFNDKEKQLQAIEQWRKYVTKNSDKIKIDWKAAAPSRGRILIAIYSGNRYVELESETGKEVWSGHLGGAFACQGLPNGNRLFASYTAKTITEFDEEGEVIQVFSNMPDQISGVTRLENGHTLVAAGNVEDRIVEIDQSGKQVWELKMDGKPKHIRMSVTGDLVVTLFESKKIVEIDRKGNVLRGIDVEGQPYSNVELQNGNLLVAYRESGIAEYSWDGEKVQSYQTETLCYHAEECENGDIIYADQTGLHRITREGEKVWSKNQYNGTVYFSQY